MMVPSARSACLEPEEADLFLRGGLKDKARDTVEVHIADCSQCRVLVSTLAKLLTPLDGLAAPSDSELEGLAAEMPAPQPCRGSLVGRYTVIDFLGAGGMAVVYRAHDPELERKVALKVLRADIAQADRRALQARLRREAQAMAQMAHPNVVAVHDVGMWDDRVFIAMELVEGLNLSQWLVQAPRAARDIVEVFVRAGRGLVAAHAAGLVHRDFKPANVMVGDDGRVRVADFGLARIAMALPDSGLAQAPSTQLQSALAGTPYYMSPEQQRGEPASPRSDQYSFCVALHAAITGEHPATGKPIEPLMHPSSVPRWLQPILRRGLSAAPGARYPSMAALLDDIARGPLHRRRIAAAILSACLLAVSAKLVTGGTRAAPTANVAAAMPAARDADVFSQAPDLREVFEREWRATHTDACEQPGARCVLQATNLLREGGYGLATTAWQAERATLVRVEGHLRLSGDGVITQAVPWPVPPRRSYSFRVRVRAPHGQTRARLSLQSAGVAGEAVATTSFVASAAWSTVSATLSSSAHHRELRAAVALDGAGELELDAAELVDVGLVDASFERAEGSQNSGRDFRAAAWVPYNLSNTVSLRSRVTDAFDGSRALQIQSTAVGGSVAQDTDQTPLAGNTYTFTAWLRAGAGAEVVDGTLALWALGTQPVMSGTVFRVGRRWTPVQVSLNVDAADYAGLRTELYLVSTNTPLEIDATSLLPAGLINASFEDEPVRWRLPDGAVRMANTPGDTVERAADGEAWLRMTAARAGEAIAQDVGAPARGATYTFAAWVRSPHGRASGRLVLRGLGGVPETGATAFQATAEWTLVTTTLTVQHDHPGLRAEVQLADAGARLDIDGTRLTGANPAVR